MKNTTRLSLLEELQSEESADAWRRFCGIYEDLIGKWLKSQGLQPADVEDVRQEVLVAVHSEIGSFRHNGRSGAFRCWLRRVVSNRLHRQWEKKSKHQRHHAEVDLSVLADHLADDASHLSVSWDRDHNVFVLNQLLQQVQKRFSEIHMEAFRRIAIDHEEAEKVADDLQMSVGAVRVAQHRILKELRRVAGDIIE